MAKLQGCGHPELGHHGQSMTPCIKEIHFVTLGGAEHCDKRLVALQFEATTDADKTAAQALSRCSSACMLVARGSVGLLE